MMVPYLLKIDLTTSIFRSSLRSDTWIVRALNCMFCLDYSKSSSGDNA